MVNQSALKVENLTKIYKTGLKAVDDISFTVEKGDFFALLGPNGAGKSTTLGMISSLINITCGNIRIFEKDVKNDYLEARKLIGIMPQEININVFRTPWQILLNQSGYFGINDRHSKERTEKLLRSVDLWEKRHVQGRFLSGGMKRRLMITRALVHDPKLLILDEPTAGVDVELRSSLWDLVKKLNKEGMTVILTTHYLEEAEALCNKIALINKGKVHVNTEMKYLLKNIEKEVFIIELNNPINSLNFKINSGRLSMIDHATLQYVSCRGTTLNSLFNELTEIGIEVSSIKPQKTKLEQFFLGVVRKNQEDFNEI